MDRVTAELLAAVVADPDDDAARAVYGDWLLARHDPRGELVLVQLELERLDLEDPRWPALAAREATLLRAFGDAWRGGIDSIVTTRFRGGCIDEITAPPSQLDGPAGELLNHHPVTGLGLRLESPAATEALVESGALRRIRRLSLHAHAELASHIDVIARSSRLPALVELVVRGRRGAALGTLVGSPLAGRLRRFAAHVEASDEVIATLAGQLPAVTWLGLRDARVGAEGASALAAPHWPALRGLDLRFAELDAEVVPVLAATLPPLDTLAIQLPLRGHGSLGQLVASPALRGVRELMLNGGALDDAAAPPLGGSFPALERLHLPSFAATATMLAARAAWPRLRDLATWIQDEPARQALIRALRHPLQRVSVGIGRELRGQLGEVIAGATGLHAVCALELSGLDDRDLRSLASVPWPALRSLRLSGEVGEPGLRALVASELPSLGRVDINLDQARLDRTARARVQATLGAHFGGARDPRVNHSSWWPWTD